MTYLAIFLQTLRTLASASHVVGRLCSNSRLATETRLEGVWVLGPGILNGLVSDLSSSGCIQTIQTVTVRTESLSGKTLAVELETLGLFAVARASLGRGGLLFVFLARGWRYAGGWSIHWFGS